MSQPKLINQVHSAIRVKNYSPRTEEAYWHWIKQFIFFHINATRMKWVNLKSAHFYHTSGQKKCDWL